MSSLPPFRTTRAARKKDIGASRDVVDSDDLFWVDESSLFSQPSADRSHCAIRFRVAHLMTAFESSGLPKNVNCPTAFYPVELGRARVFGEHHAVSFGN